MICHVVDQVARSERVDLVIVATDDQRIHDAVTAHGAMAVMTRADHPNGSSRVAEVVSGLPQGMDMVVNVQGDEPEIDPKVIDLLVARMQCGEESMGTIASPFAAGQDPRDPNIVKVVVNRLGQAMYFSRSLIPYDRDARGLTPLKHIGMYAYRRAFLEMYPRLCATECERLEQLEQLRVLEHGHRIAVVVEPVHHHGIDTPEQYAAFVERYRSGR